MKNFKKFYNLAITYSPNKVVSQLARSLLKPFPMELLMLFLLVQSIHGQQLSRAMHGMNMKRSHSFLNHPPPSEVLALWIDGAQVEKITGIFLDVDIIRGGIVNYQLKTLQPNELPILPHDLDHVKLAWMAQKETFRYSFSKLKSLNPEILYDPLLSIPSSGDVPKSVSVFEITIPCTKNKTGLAALYVELNITNSLNQPIPGSPLQFRVKKKCFGTDGNCHCKNGGKCLEGGLCSCLADSYGMKCQFKTGRCDYPCLNGGVCNQFNSCSCPQGFAGKYCQRPVCSQDCGAKRICVAPDVCDCKPLSKGIDCNKAVRVHPRYEHQKSRRRKRTRKQRQSEAGQKENAANRWKKKVLMKPRLDHLSSRYPAWGNKKKRLLPSNRGRLRIANNNYAFDARNLAYRKRYAPKENMEHNYYIPNENYYINHNNKKTYRNDVDIPQNNKIVKYNFKKNQKKIRTAYPYRSPLVSHPIRRQTTISDAPYNDANYRMKYVHPNSINNNDNGNYIIDTLANPYRMKNKQNGLKDTNKKRKRTRNLRHNFKSKNKDRNKKSKNKRKNKKQIKRKTKQTYATNEFIEHAIMKNDRHPQNTTFDVRSLRRPHIRSKKVNRKKYKKNRKVSI